MLRRIIEDGNCDEIIPVFSGYEIDKMKTGVTTRISILDIMEYFIKKEKIISHKKLHYLCFYTVLLYAGKHKKIVIENDFIFSKKNGVLNKTIFYKFFGQKILTIKDVEINKPIENKKLNKILETVFELYSNINEELLKKDFKTTKIYKEYIKNYKTNFKFNVKIQEIEIINLGFIKYKKIIGE